MTSRGNLLAALLLLAGLATGCGSDDDAPEGGADAPAEAASGAGSAEAATELDLSCEFAPSRNAEAMSLGDVTVTGTNDTESRIDSLTVTMTLQGSSGEVETAASVPYFLPGEELAQWVPVLGEYDGELSQCEVTETAGAQFAGEPTIDPEGAACTVSGEPGLWALEADLARVEGAPFAAARFVGLVAEVDGARHGISEKELPAGETTLEGVSSSQAEPTCAVRYVREL